MAEEKNVKKTIDRIKLNKKKIENSRSIVLESIGEDIQPKIKTIDSLRPLLKKEVKIKPKQPKKEEELPKNKKVLDSLDFLNPIDKNELKEKKIDANFKERINKNKINSALIQDINKKGISYDNLVAITSERKVKEKPNKKNIKKKKISKIKKPKNKSVSKFKKQDVKPKKPKIKKNHLKIFLHLISDFSNRHKSNSIKNFKRSISLCFLLFIIFILLYFALTTTVLKFNIDNNFFRWTNKYIPIPAFIAKGKVIDYYLWQDIIKRTNDKTKTSARIDLARYLVINELAEKYNLNRVDFLNLNNEEIIEQIARRAVNDVQVNQVALNRIHSIREMIKTKNDFIRVSEKYGDDLGKANINEQNKGQYPYADAVRDLKVNEISDVVSAQDGHYIFLCFEKTAEEQALSYVFIKNKPFEQILNDLIVGYKIISFVD
ncbi:hypothetical protein KAU09_00885 [Candidatus Parcubacteria bacterium]|nr:hypothetical protein [Candidatus Parcubacteria bacterium]